MQNYSPVWFQLPQVTTSGSFDQTYEEFAALKDFLCKYDGNVKDHTVRTWLYCRDVDNNYAGLVQARNKFFAENGLTSDTHFIASTGIEAQMADVKQLVMMDSINYPTLQDGQMHYLYALENLSPTAIYGVSFERGTRLILGDRSHYFISGTASIDKDGIVLHNFDTAKQTYRIMDNIEALMQEGEGSLDDIKIATMYLRDPADADICRRIVFERLGREIPLVTVKAPVCRPAWLVEIECIAVNNKGNSQYPALA
jgi:enamine deaminase RidA (YjgF/YER057c/UK114 family)